MKSEDAKVHNISAAAISARSYYNKYANVTTNRTKVKELLKYIIKPETKAFPHSNLAIRAHNNSKKSETNNSKGETTEMKIINKLDFEHILLTERSMNERTVDVNEKKHIINDEKSEEHSVYYHDSHILFSLSNKECSNFVNFLPKERLDSLAQYVPSLVMKNRQIPKIEHTKSYNAPIENDKISSKSDVMSKMILYPTFHKKNSYQANSFKPSKLVNTYNLQIQQKPSESSLQNKNKSTSKLEIRPSDLDKKQFESTITFSKVDSLKSLKNTKNLKQPVLKGELSVSKQNMEKLKMLSKTNKMKNINMLIGGVQKVELIDTEPSQSRKLNKKPSKNETLSSDSAKQLKTISNSKIFNSNSSHDLEYKIYNHIKKTKVHSISKNTVSEKSLRNDMPHQKGHMSQRKQYNTIRQTQKVDSNLSPSSEKEDCNFWKFNHLIGSTQKLRKDIETLKLKHKLSEKAKIEKTQINNVHKVIDLTSKSSSIQAKQQKA